MSQYKDFQGKTLDDAIREACVYYGVAREKLEIEIISDAKSGIFGLVGAKKASIRAARVQLPEFISSLTPPEETPPAETASLPKPVSSPGQAEAAAQPRPDAVRDRPQRDSRGNEADRTSEKSRSRRDGGTKAASGRGSASGTGGTRSEAPDGNIARPAGAESAENAAPAAAFSPPSGNAAPTNGRGRRTGRSGGKDAEPSEGSSRARSRRNDDRNPAKAGKREPRRGPGQERPKDAHPAAMAGLASDALPDFPRDELPEFSLDGCDRDELFAVVCSVVQRLVEPIVGDAPCTVEIHGNRVRASVDCGDASGLLVGREGQTLAAVQYLASRIIAKRIGGSLRLNIDAGNYRERQDDKLKDLALSLAERAKATRRAQSTRPLSAYQRRIIHLALEEDDAVQTHSKGEGAQRRVIIQLKRTARDSGKNEEERDCAPPEAVDGETGANRDEALSPNFGEPPAAPEFHPEDPDREESRIVTKE